MLYLTSFQTRQTLRYKTNKTEFKIKRIYLKMFYSSDNKTTYRFAIQAKWTLLGAEKKENIKVQQSHNLATLPRNDPIYRNKCFHFTYL